MVGTDGDGQLTAPPASAPRIRFALAAPADDTAIRRISASPILEGRVTLFGRTSDDQKLELMRRASVLVSTSVKEGWGLIVTEANSMGSPAIVYDADGLRSAAGRQNWISAPNPPALGARLADGLSTS